jgi:hypothetical protein
LTKDWLHLAKAGLPSSKDRLLLTKDGLLKTTEKLPEERKAELLERNAFQFAGVVKQITVSDSDLE